jgi:glycine/D-amino acid oxidase-like deaminating enzyme
MDAASALIEVAEGALGSTVITGRGLLRLATDARKLQAFRRLSRRCTEVSWWETPKDERLTNTPGVWIPAGVTIDCPRYLEGLEQACRAAGVEFISHHVESLEELSTYDQIVLCGGHLTSRMVDLPLTSVKGQIVRFAWPREAPPLPFAVSGYGYVAMSPDGLSCLAGATFEHAFDSEEPDHDLAIRDVRRRVSAYFPLINELEPTEVYSGVRATTPDRKPICQRLSERVWTVTGLGSKGLLWHASLAHEVGQQLLPLNKISC